VTKQGRAGLVAFKRYRGGTSAVGKAFYKGGFEQKMTRKEAALILETTFVFSSTRTPSGSND
jgi:DnaJ family protein C protein 19